MTNWKEGIAVTPGSGKGDSALGWDGAERGTGQDKSSIEPWREQTAPAAQRVLQADPDPGRGQAEREGGKKGKSSFPL